MGETTDSGELIQGTVEMLILKLSCAARSTATAWPSGSSKHRSKYSRSKRAASHPALHRMELRGLLKSKWGTSDNNRRAKFYGATTEGQKKLNAEAQRWARLSSAVAFVMQAS